MITRILTGQARRVQRRPSQCQLNRIPATPYRNGTLIAKVYQVDPFVRTGLRVRVRRRAAAGRSDLHVGKALRRFSCPAASSSNSTVTTRPRQVITASLASWSTLAAPNARAISARPKAGPSVRPLDGAGRVVFPGRYCRDRLLIRPACRVWAE